MTSLPNIIVQLIHIEGPLKGEIQELLDQEILIGRFPHCQVHFPIDLAVISRNHAKIIREGNRFKLIDSSTNGTFVNGKRVTDHYLKSGDVITFSEGGPKVSFLTQIVADHLKINETISPATDIKQNVELDVTAEVPLSDLQAPFVMQYGPTLHSLKLPITMGKAPDCNFTLEHPQIMDHHAQFFFSKGQYWVKDLTGKNLISIDGRVIGTEAMLNPDNILNLSSNGPAFRFLGGGRFAEYNEG